MCCGQGTSFVIEKEAFFQKKPRPLLVGELTGCVVVGTITATGGGTVRDLLLGNNPVFWMQETEYLWMCVITCISVFFLWSYLAEHGKFISYCV